MLMLGLIQSMFLLVSTDAVDVIGVAVDSFVGSLVHAVAVVIYHTISD